jgi:hypothetical protein
MEKGPSTEGPCIARGICTSTTDLRRKLMQYHPRPQQDLPPLPLELLHSQPPHPCQRNLRDSPLGRLSDGRRTRNDRYVYA